MQLRVRRTESGGGRGGPLVRAKPGQLPLSFDVTPVSEDRGNGLENAAFCAPQAGTFVLGLGWLERSSGVIRQVSFRHALPAQFAVPPSSGVGTSCTRSSTSSYSRRSALQQTACML